MKSKRSFEFKYLALVIVTIVVTTAVWFGVRSINVENAERQAEEQQELARTQSKGIPMGTSVEVTATEEDDEVTRVYGWYGSMEFTVTGATLYRDLESCKASDEALYNAVLEHQPLNGSLDAGFSPSLLVVDLTVTNIDATTQATSGDAVYPSTYINLANFRLGTDDRLVQTLLWIDGSVDSESDHLWSYVSIEQGETKQLRLAFCAIPQDSYDRLMSGADLSDLRIGQIGAIYGQYVYGEGEALSLCLGWAPGSGSGFEEHVDAIPYVFELIPEVR